LDKNMDDTLLYRTVNQIATCGRYPFTVGQMRTLLLSREKNGLNQAVRKIGRRLYFKVDVFEKWMDNQRESTLFDT